MCFGSSILVFPRTYLFQMKTWFNTANARHIQALKYSPRERKISAHSANSPTTLHHKDGWLVILCIDPVEKHPQVQVLKLPKLQAIVDELEAQCSPMGEGKEVSSSPHLLSLLLGEGRQARAEPLPHAGRVVSICKQRPGKPAQDVVQGALALPQALQAGSARLDPVRGQRHGELSLLPRPITAVVEMPRSCMSLEDREMPASSKGRKPTEIC